MGAFRYTPPDEAARRRQQPPRQPGAIPTITQRQPQQRNVEAVLSLGDVRYITFRGQTYRIPPVPYKLGQQVLDAYTKVNGLASDVARTGSKESSDEYFRAMQRLTTLLWRHIRPIGSVRRALWRVGGLANPFREASEKEVNDVSDFFLQGRMMSSVRSISEAEVHP
jgi:hypothetical protein